MYQSKSGHIGDVYKMSSKILFENSTLTLKMHALNTISLHRVSVSLLKCRRDMAKKITRYHARGAFAKYVHIHTYMSFVSLSAKWWGVCRIQEEAYRFVSKNLQLSSSLWTMKRQQRRTKRRRMKKKKKKKRQMRRLPQTKSLGLLSR